MHLLLTGGSGSVGKAVIERLSANGHSVLVIGRRAGLSFPGAEYRSCDINDYPSLLDAARGSDMIIHLAAIPDPGGADPQEIFRINCSGSFNVFQAAATLGIRKVIQASSINAAGQFYGIKPAPLHYLPLDELHPVFSTDAYSFSKNVVEAVADYFWRREGISSLSLRLPWVAPQEIHEGIQEWRDSAARFCAELSAKPREEQLTWFRNAWDHYNQYRAERPYEPPKAGETRDEMESDYMNLSRMIMGQRVNFFTMLDERDSAQSIEKGLLTDFEGSHALFINDYLNWTGVPSATLINLFYPDVPILKKDFTGQETLVSIDAARELIGFEPQYTFGG